MTLKENTYITIVVAKEEKEYFLKYIYDFFDKDEIVSYSIHKEYISNYIKLTNGSYIVLDSQITIPLKLKQDYILFSNINGDMRDRGQ